MKGVLTLLLLEYGFEDLFPSLERPCNPLVLTLLLLEYGFEDFKFYARKKLGLVLTLLLLEYGFEGYKSHI